MWWKTTRNFNYFFIVVHFLFLSQPDAPAAGEEAKYVRVPRYKLTIFCKIFLSNIVDVQYAFLFVLHTVCSKNEKIEKIVEISGRWIIIYSYFGIKPYENILTFPRS